MSHESTFYHFRSALEIIPRSFAPREVTQQALTPRSHSITPLDMHNCCFEIGKQTQGKWMLLQPLDPIHLAIHFQIFFRSMLEVTPQSLTPRTWKSTVSKSVGLLFTIDTLQDSTFPFSTQAWTEKLKLHGFLHVFQFMLLAKKPVKASGWSRKHFAKDAFAASEVGRAATANWLEWSSIMFQHVSSSILVICWWYLDVSWCCFLWLAGLTHVWLIWLMSGWSQQGMQGQKGMEGLCTCGWLWWNLNGVTTM